MPRVTAFPAALDLVHLR